MTIATRPRPGATVGADGVSYRVWAPDHATVRVRVERVGGGGEELALRRDDRGYFAATDPRGRAGDRYGFLLGDAREVRPDPASRFQPDGVHGLSEAIDPWRFAWREDRWRRPGWRGQSIYELHVGTFTLEGTFLSAIEKLPHLAALGVGAIELMPLADFPGRRNWGYDGVALFAPARCYGRPDDLRALVDAAHASGLAVIVDVVYNHLGPDGNYLGLFAREYFREDRHTPWGAALNFAGPAGSRAQPAGGRQAPGGQTGASDDRDGNGSADTGAGGGRGAQDWPVREFFLANAASWFDEYRVDGLRLDATHAIIDESAPGVLAEIAAVAHARGGFVIAEDERNTAALVTPAADGGAGLDAVWADDFNHQLRALLLAGREKVLGGSFGGAMADVAKTIDEGWFYTGQPFPFWAGRGRGEPAAHLPAAAFVCCIENHDQAGNRALGERLSHLVGPEVYRAAAALLCLGPHPPLLFMGQEWAASAPFLYFTDHHGELGRLVSEGRRREFPSHREAGDVPDPQAPGTFERSKLDWGEVGGPASARTLACFRAALGQRNAWLDPEQCRRERWRVAAVGAALAIRYAGHEAQPERLVVCALQPGVRLALDEAPLLAPPVGRRWRVEFDSNAETFGRAPEFALPAVETLVFGEAGTLLLVAREEAGRC